MFKLRLADYINQNMLARDMTYKDLHELSGVPDSSLHSYAQAKVNNPSDENLIRIAAAFGDGPDVIQRMRRESMSSTMQENMLIAESADQEKMEQYGALIRASVAKLLEEFREQSAAQQTEIIQHADNRVSNAYREFKLRADEVLRQCNAETAKEKAVCEEKIAMMSRHCQDLLSLKDEQMRKSDLENEKMRIYLKIVIRNLTAALIAVSAFAVIGLACLGGYAFFAYQTFDRADPTRGLFRGGVSIGPVSITLGVISAFAAVSLFVYVFMKKRRTNSGAK